MEQNTKSNAWFDKTWLVVVLCLFIFPVGLYALWKNTKISKGWKIAVTVIIVLIFIGNISGKGSSSSSSTETSEQDASKEWVNVFEFDGNGMKKSESFKLNGGKTKLLYAYQGEKGLGMGMFSAYVVDEGDDIMRTGGVPEIMTQAESDKGETYIRKSSGEYYLNVMADGQWKVIVQELK